jgi:hypothetical protein
MKKLIHLNDWLSQAISSDKNVVTIHLNSISDCEIEGVVGLDLVRATYEILNSAVAFMQSLSSVHKVRHVILFLPLNTSSDLMNWSPDFWNKLDCIDEPSSIYLLRDVLIFDEESEEYRCPIILPFEDRFQYRAIFRSFRNQEAIENSWEFTSGIYLIADTDLA